jgi:hypothetical protein
VAVELHAYFWRFDVPIQPVKLSAHFYGHGRIEPDEINGAPVSTTPFVFGTITGQTGANSGYRCTIYGFKRGSNVSVKLALFFPSPSRYLSDPAGL